MTENIKNCFSHAQGNFAAVFIIQASLQKSSEPPDYYFWVDGLATFWAPRSAPLAVRRTPDDSPPQPPSPTPPLHHPDVEMSICCHRTAFSVLTGLFAVLGWPTECQRERRGGGPRHGRIDGWRGWEGGGVTVPKREVGGGAPGADLSDH